MKAHPKSLPPLRSDAEAEAFVNTADLSQYDLSGFRPMRFEIEPKAISEHAAARFAAGRCEGQG